MAIDHFWIEPKGDVFEFDDAGYEEWKTKPFYLAVDNVYIELYLKAVSGTAYIQVTVTDSDGGTATGTTNTAETSYQPKTGDNRISIDCSGLTTGEATCKIETKGNGAHKDVYGYQSS